MSYTPKPWVASEYRAADTGSPMPAPGDIQQCEVFSRMSCMCVYCGDMCASWNNVSVWSLSGRIFLLWKSIEPTWANIYSLMSWELCSRNTKQAAEGALCRDDNIQGVYVCLSVWVFPCVFFYPFVCFDITSHTHSVTYCNRRSIVGESFSVQLFIHIQCLSPMKWWLKASWWQVGMNEEKPCRIFTRYT